MKSVAQVLAVATCIVAVAFGSPVPDNLETRADSCSSSASVLTISKLSADIPSPLAFCNWYLSDVRMRSPVSGVSIADLNSACKCIGGAKATSRPAATTTMRAASPATTACSAANVKLVKSKYKDSATFCQFYLAYPRDDSPMLTLGPKGLWNACKCILGQAVTTTSSTTISSTTTTSSITITSSSTSSASSLSHIPTVTVTHTVSDTAAFTSPITTIVPTTVSTFTSTADLVTVYSTIGTVITTCIPSGVAKRGLLSSNVGGSSTSPSRTTTSSTTAEATSTSTLASAVSPAVTVTRTQTLSTTSYPTTIAYSSVTAAVTVTGTTTIPTTSTFTVNYCPAPSSCDNEGIRWAYYNNTEYHRNDLYPNYDPTIIKTETPGYRATASVCGGLDEGDVDNISIYGSTETFESDYFTLNHVGYIFAEVSGIYTFTFTSVDDIAFLWLGDNAYSGWTRNNANMYAVHSSSSATGDATTTYTLVAEQYLAFRIVFGQAQGAVEFFFSVAGPDGTIILDSDTEDSPYLVQYSCDGTTAPAFPAFGSET